MIQMDLNDIQKEMREIHERLKAQDINTEAAMVGAFITVLAMAFRAETPTQTQEIVMNTACSLIEISTAIIMHMAMVAELESTDAKEDEPVREFKPQQTKH